MGRKYRVENVVNVIIGLLFASAYMLYGQFQEGWHKPPTLMPFVLLALACLLALIIGVPKQTVPVLSDKKNSGSLKMRGAVRWLVVAIVAISIALLRITNTQNSESFGLIALLWLVAICAYFWFVKKIEFEGTERVGWGEEGKRPIILLLIIALVAFLVRVINLETLPFVLSGDEASFGGEIIKVMTSEMRNPFTAGWLGQPSMTFFYNSLTFRLFDSPIFGLRFAWVLMGTASVVTTYLLAKELKGKTFALFTAALVTFFHFHIHYSRTGLNNIADTFFMSFALYYLYRGLKTSRLTFWGVSGILTGLSLYFYTGARLTIVIMLAVIAYQFVRFPKQAWQTHKWGAVVFIVGFLIAGAPYLQFGYRFPDEFNSRMNQVGIVQSGWLEREVELTGKSTPAILFDQFHRAALAFNYYPDRTEWQGLGKPLLDPAFGMLFLFGLALGTIQLLRKHSDNMVMPMVAWWWGGVLSGGMLTENPPSSQRLVTLAIPTCFFMAYAVFYLIDKLKNSWPSLNKPIILAFLTLLFAYSNFQTYFVEYAKTRTYGGSRAEFAMELVPILDDYGQTHEINFLGPPFMYWDFPTNQFLSPHAAGIDITDPWTPLAIDLDQPRMFVVLAERKEELPLITTQFPNGSLTTINSSNVEETLLGYVYLTQP